MSHRYPSVVLTKQQLLPPLFPALGAADATRHKKQMNESACLPAPHPSMLHELQLLEAMARASIQKKRPLMPQETSMSSNSIFYREESPLVVLSMRDQESACQLTNTAVGQNLQEEAIVMNISKVEAPAPMFRPVLLSCPHDSLFLTEHQTFLRTHVEVFAVTAQDIEVPPTKGRNTKRLRVGQIGVRCRHCAHVAMKHRTKGSTYFPASTMGIYQATQNMCAMHLQCGLCPEMTDATRDLFSFYLARKTAAGSSAGRAYWTQQAKLLGLVDTDAGIFPMNAIPPGVNALSPDQMKHYSTKRKSNDTSS